MTLEDAVNGLKSGSILVLDGGHRQNDLLNQVERHLRDYQKRLRFHEGKPSDERLSEVPNSPTHGDMTHHYRLITRWDFGHPQAYNSYCYNCGQTLMVIPLDEKSVALVGSDDFFRISEVHGNRYGYQFKSEDMIYCPAFELSKQSALVANIEVPSGILIFANFFRTAALYEPPDDNINSLMGRNQLMQHLAVQNVGYGQMGNMSIAVYSNGLDEILIVDPYLDDSIADLEYEIEEGRKAFNQLTDLKGNSDVITEEDLLQAETQLSKFKAFQTSLLEREFLCIGSVSLAVWRWQCADRQVLDEHQEDLSKLEKIVTVLVSPGRYHIEHFFEFSDRDNPLYSRIRLVSAGT